MNGFIFFVCSFVLVGQVLALPVLTLISPVNDQVVQRETRESGWIKVAGELSEPATEAGVIEARLGVGGWQEVAKVGAEEPFFAGRVRGLAGAWKTLEVRLRAGKEILAKGSVERVGVGEVFVIAGQSNSANHGEEKQKVMSGLVSTFDGKAWRIAHDPQPGASGGGGSFIPPFADEIAKRFEVPVGIVSTGVGATSVREWLPKGVTFPNPPTILNKVSKRADGKWESKGGTYAHFILRMKSLGRNGFRAVLWHQGESDANQSDSSRTLPGGLYQEYLTKVITSSQSEIGWEAPWFVAQASYHIPSDPGSPEIRAAQKAVWEAGVAFAGPDSDALDGANRDNGGKGVHFSGPGLRAHGLVWAEKVAPWLAGELKRKKVKVFILAGQSNMEGQGVVSMAHEDHYNGGKGNLVWSMEHSQSRDKMKHLRDEKGNWVKRDDVEIFFKAKEKNRSGPLTIGYTGYGGRSHIGPELQFGHVVGDHFEEPVLVIKTAWGGKSLQVDFRSPTSGGETGEYYLKMIEEVREALAGLEAGEFEIAGFVWMQGWNDMVSAEATTEYEANLVNLIKDVRAEFRIPNLPVMIGELGNGGAVPEGSGMAKFRAAQKRGAARIEGAEFVETHGFARPKELSPNLGHGHHWFGNAESYFLVGDALGRGMLEKIGESAEEK
jgi:hypothetical protein